MTTKTFVIVWITSGAIAFATGRWAAPTKVVTETKTVEVEKKTTDTEAERNKHKETTTTTTERPDGVKETTTKTVEDTNTSKNSHSDTDITKDSTTKTETSYNKPSLTVFGLYGLNLDSPHSAVWGVSVNKQVFGPVGLGLWGLSDKTFGASVSLTF